jgi:hypothetical protein
MPDLLADGASLVADAISDHASQTVTYRREGKDITGVKAARGQPVREIDTQYGVLRIVSVPWFIKPSLLVYSSETWTPQKNDVIVESNGAEWQVLPTDVAAELVLGSFGELWRVETKRVTVNE